MKSIQSSLKFLALGSLVLCVCAGCGSTDGGGSVSAGVYYGVGFYDPWYYGDYHHDIDVIVPPPDRPVVNPRPSQPIARPAPMPSIPSTPRASFRR